MEKIPEELKNPATTLAEEMCQGKWNHCYDPNKRDPFPDEIIDELQRMVPGYSMEQYQQSIGFGLFVTR